MTPGQLFSYWRQMDKDHPDRLTAYVYRTWPVIDKRQEDPKAYLYIGKESAAFANPDDWRSEMLHRYGSGNYKLILSDDALSKGVGQTIVTDLRDPEYPPVIENLDELVMDDPANQSFIENLRQKGILPGEKDMAAGEVVAGLTGTIERLSNRLTEKGKEPAPAPAQSATDTAKATVEMAGEVFKQGIALGQASVEAQADAKVKAAEAQVAASNPMSSFDTLTKLVNLVREMQPPAKAEVPSSATTGIAEGIAQVAAIYNSVLERESKLHGTIMAMMDSRVQGLERLIQERSANPASAPAPKDDLISSLDKLAGIKDKLQSLFGGGDSDEKEEKVPAWMNLAQSALAGLPSVATSLLAMSYNMAVAKTGNGQPILPAPAPDAPPAIDPGSSANPNPTGETMPVYLAMLRQIERPLINHLNDNDKTGADFAAALMDFHGRIAYDSIREQGKDTLMALLNSYPPIANVIQQIPERTSQFMDDFLNADAILAAEDAEDEASGGGPPVVIDIPPVVQHQEGARAKRRAAPSV
jgi:hypothetical protein